MWKSASAWPGARATFLTRPIRRSELMNVPSFSPQPAAGSTRWAQLRGLGGGVHVLHDQEVEPARARRGASSWLIHECAGLVAMTHRPLILPAQDAFDDLVVGPAVLGRECAPRRCPACRRPCARCVGVGEVVAAEQVGRVAEQPRAHRVALAGDRVGAGAGAADVAGHQREVDDRLRGAHALVALVDAHRPPERHALAVVDRRGEALDRSARQAGRRDHALGRELRRRAPRTRRSPWCARR